jgi:hypothetical protein
MTALVRRTLVAASITLALGYASSAQAIYVAPTVDSAYPLFTSIAGSVSYDGWNQLNRTGLGFTSSQTAAATQALVDGIQANVAGSGDAVLTRLSGTLYPAGSALYNAGNNNPQVLSLTDSTVVSGITTLVLQSYVGLLQPASYATAVLNINGGTQSLAATSVTGVVVGSDGEAYRTWSWDLTGLGAVDSYSMLMTVGGGAVQAWAFQVDQVAAVPEPASLALMMAGFGVVGFAARRRRLDA